MVSKIRTEIRKPTIKIFAVPNGGKYIAGLLAIKDPFLEVVNSAFRADVIVDDIYETGRTIKKFAKFKKPAFFLIDKRNDKWANKWIEFPYDQEDVEKEREDLAVRLLEHFGNNKEVTLKFLTKIANNIKTSNKVKLKRD